MAYNKGSFPFKANGRAKAMDDTDGFRELLFRPAHRRDFWVGVDDFWDCVVVHMATEPGHVFDGGDALFLGFVRQHRTWDDITDGPYAVDRGRVAVIDRDEPALVELDGFVKIVADAKSDRILGIHDVGEVTLRERYGKARLGG